jgi:tellurite resistance-related uncharacterized protein
MDSSASSFGDRDNLSLLLPMVTTTVTLVVTTILIMACLSPTSAFISPLQRAMRFLHLRASATGGGMQTLPDDVVQYSQVPQTGHFTADKIPRGLLKDHTTKAGTWGVIRVHAGKLEYTIQEPTQSIHEITPETQPGGIVEPQVKHHVKALTDDLQFVVEFHRKPGTGPVDEKREGL